MFPNKASKAAAILFVISLGFNVFFVIAVVRTRTALRQLKTPEGRVEFVADRLKLDDDQRERVSRQMTDLWAKQSEARQANAAATDAFWAEAVSDHPDTVKINHVIEEASGQAAETMRCSIDHLLLIMNELTPAQRQELARIIRERESWKESLASGEQ